MTTPTGLRLRANTVARIKYHRLSHRTIEIRTNSLGYRNREIGAKKHTRVLFIGDSITLADYLAEEETFVRITEALSRQTNHPLETVNAGVGAIGLQNELAILSETGLGIDPDVVVLGFYLNDAQPSQGVHTVSTPRSLDGYRTARLLMDQLDRIRGPEADDEGTRALYARWRAPVEKSFPAEKGDPLTDPAAFNARILKNFRGWGSAWSDEAWEFMRPTLAEFARLAEEHDFQLLFVCFPTRLQVQAEFIYDLPQRRFKEIAQDLNVPLLDLLPPFRKASAGEGGRLYYDPAHHTVRGNQLIAEWIHESLQHLLAN